MGAVRSSWPTRLVAALVVSCPLVAGGCGLLHTASSGPLPSVSPAPTPQAPVWIVRYGPRGTVDTLAQIRVEFKDPLIPLESIETPDENAKLAYFAIEPALPGRFRFLTPHLVGFQADTALPVATRVRVVIKHGLTDLRGDTLAGDFAWTFNTQPLELTSRLPDGPLALTPTLEFSSNAELDAASLDAKTTVAARGDPSVPIKVTLEKTQTPEGRDPSEIFDPSQRDWYYAVTVKRPLAKATEYTLTVGAGVMPAHGNLPLAASDAFAATFHTYAPLAFKALVRMTSRSDFERFEQGDPELTFNNPIDQTSERANVTISPTPNPWADLLDQSYGDTSIPLEPAAFNPATHYVITLGAGLKDSFGQTLGTPVTVPFDSGDTAPAFWAPSGFNIFPSGSDLRLEVSSVNLKRPQYWAAYRVVSPPDLVYIDPTNTDPNGTDSSSLAASGFLPNWKPYPLPHPRRNAADDVPLSLARLIGAPTGMLAYEVGADIANSANGGNYYGAVQLTNLGVFAQWFPDGGVVLVHHLSDGSPASGARVDIYRSQLGDETRKPQAPCASATTNASGSATFTSSSLTVCMGGAASFKAAPDLLAVVHEGPDWSFARSLEWSGAYGYGIYPGWDGGTPQSCGTIYSDRDLYQQGETGWFTGAAYYTLDGVLHRDANARYRLTLEDPSGKKSDLGVSTTDAFGSFSRRVTFASDQALGYYIIHAKSAAGVEIDGQFRVAQFRPPNFKVALTLDKQYATPGDTVNAASSSAYLFGAPVQGGKTTFYVTRNPAYLAPPGWDEFSFGPQWPWPETQPSVDSDVVQNAQTTAADGSARQAISIARDLPYPMTYQVDAQTSDVSNLSVSDSKTFLAVPDKRLIGIKTDWIAQAGKPADVALIVTDPAGVVRRGVRIHVELQSMQYDSVTQLLDNGQTALNQIEYKMVAQTDVVSGTDPVSVSLTPPAGGEYRVRANLAGASGDATASDSFVWVTGENPVFWSSENPDQLQIKLDKQSYKPGDWATALIQSPYPAGELYFAVIRHDTMYHTVERVHGGAPTVRFRVTPDMLPNAAVEAVLVRTGAPLSRIKPGTVDSLARIGFAPFDVSAVGEHLKLTISPVHASVEPGGAQTVDLTLADARGTPVRGEFTVAVANESVLQLSGYRLPDLVNVVYADRDITTRFADNRPNVVLQQPPSPVDKGWGFGGGFSQAAASTRVRTNFKPIAFFAGAVQTDAHGHASVSFHVPDDLTTWRVMAVASSLAPPGSTDFKFATADTTFTATKPLVTNALLPQFARPGDTFMAGVSVTNAAGLRGPLRVSGTTSGSLHFNETSGPTSGDSAQETLGAGTQAVRFPVVAGAPGDARVSFSTAASSASDAFALSIPVVSIEYPEEVVESGVTADAASIPIAIDRDVRLDSGGLELTLASTLLPEITEPAARILDQDCLPFTEPAATQLLMAAYLERISRTYGRVSAPFSPQAIAAKDVAYLARLKMPSGGLADWPGARRADPFLTAYAAESLGAAQAAGFHVDRSLIDGIRAFLHGALADPQQFPLCTDDCVWEVRFDALEGLAALGETRDDFLSDIYSKRDELALSYRIRIARYLLRLPAWRQQGHAMAAKLRESVYETGRTATVNSSNYGWWYDSVDTNQALMLQLMIADGQNGEFVDRMVEGLLALRRDGRWRNEYDDARALGALVDYGALESAPPAFSATAVLGTRTIGSAQFSGYSDPLRSFDAPMRTLTPGTKPVLALKKSGTGTLHYFVSYSYSLSGPQSGAIQGLRVIRYIRDAGQTPVIGISGLAAPTAPLQLGAGRVFDIEVEVIVDHPVDNVVITDPLPAGLEAVDTSFRTSTQAFQAALTDSWQIDYQTIYRDRVVAFGDHLDAGDYSFHYLARSVTPGTFSWPGAQAQLEYAPEIFGRTSSGQVVISQ